MTNKAVATEVTPARMVLEICVSTLLCIRDIPI